MTDKRPLTSDQLAAILDNAPVGVYVNALDTWELLYADRLVRKLFLRKPKNEDIRTLTCYEAAGFDSPCPFCRVKSMGKSELLVREFTHSATQRIYQLSGKIIDWDDRPAHIEFIVDITAKRQEEDRSNALREELETTLSNIPCGLCVYRFDGKQISPVYHNPSFYQIMGYSVSNISQTKKETEFLNVHPEDLGKLQEKIIRTIKNDGKMDHTYRVFSDHENCYRWIHLEGAVKPQSDGTKLLYGSYSDVSGQIHLEKELAGANEKMQDIINAIPGGVAIYKASDIFQTVYYSAGVPELTGYSPEEYRELVKGDAADLIYPGDRDMVVENVMEAVSRDRTADFEFRKVHRDGHMVWVHIQAKKVGEEDGCPLIQCVFHNITALKETQLEKDHLINSIPGGIAIFQMQDGRFKPIFSSDGVMALSGYTRSEFEQLIRKDVTDMIYEKDRIRVITYAKAAMENQEALDVSFRIRHRDGRLIWIHLNGRCMGVLAEWTKFYAIFTGMSAEARLFQNIAAETADAIYVIDRENYDLLYVSESSKLFTKQRDWTGQKCFAALQGKSEPCEFCAFNKYSPDGTEHEMTVEGSDRIYSTKFRETDWNGIPAYVKYIRDVTEEMHIRREKERLEQYFQTMVRNLPGGVAVICYGKDGRKIPEFLSEGFTAMVEMTLEKAWQLYGKDMMEGVYPEDRGYVEKQIAQNITGGEGHCEIQYRLLRGNGSYIWVKNALTLLHGEGGEAKIYAMYHDITQEKLEQETLQQQYKDILIKHYRTPDPDALVIGHCNITKNVILEIIDYTDSELSKRVGSEREAFFIGISTFIPDEKERKEFLDTYLNVPALEAFRKGDVEKKVRCFMKMPKDPTGHYVQVKVNLVEAPDSGDVTGIMQITDITAQVISERILHQLSAASYDFIADIDLLQDSYRILTHDKSKGGVPPLQGKHSWQTQQLIQALVLPRDKEKCQLALSGETMTARLGKEGTYSISYSIADGRGDIRTKKTIISAVDLRLGRVCLARTDITDSIREQQGLLNVIAYTFDLAGFIEISTQSLTMYTRKTVLENLPPYFIENYDQAVGQFAENYEADDRREEAGKQLQLGSLVSRLEEKPSGYDFLFPYKEGDSVLYKQINVLWGDENHRTICVVRADVTDMVTGERKAKEDLENALVLAEEANRAKSDFLSAMSHDIRTPMNGIMGMTALAAAYIDDRSKVADCLEKIAISSKHLLSLINDVLDMSKIERSAITLNWVRITVSELVRQITAILAPQAEASGLQFTVCTEDIQHECFKGDTLRINQILINMLSNAVKFTPKGGSVYFEVRELAPLKIGQWVRYRFTVRDTGIGMSAEFLAHIFEPFARSQNPKVSHIEGTGLGLSIVKGLVDLMEGTIDVQSTVNKGTTFTIELEFESLEPGRREGGATRVSPPDLGEENIFAGRRFLVAEDNEINAEILGELLAIYQAETVVRENGIQVVEAFKNAPPGTYDAIFMDIQMPVMNGYDAARAIRALARPDGARIPIIAMTANAFAEDIQEAKRAGMDGHVAKPIDLEILKNILIEVLM